MPKGAGLVTFAVGTMDVFNIDTLLSMSEENCE